MGVGALDIKYIYRVGRALEPYNNNTIFLRKIVFCAFLSSHHGFRRRYDVCEDYDDYFQLSILGKSVQGILTKLAGLCRVPYRRLKSAAHKIPGIPVFQIVKFLSLWRIMKF